MALSGQLLPTTRKLARPVNTSAFVDINQTGELITSGLPVIRQLRIHCVSQAERRLHGYGRAFMASLSSTGITPTANAVPSSSPMDGRGLWGCLVPSRVS